MKALSIYADLPPPASRPGPRLSLVPAARPAKPIGDIAVPASVEHAILAILDSPAAGETIEAAFRRKEHELGELFAGLSVFESRALLKRFSDARDPLAARFGRLVAARRERLLAFLADARRREAIAAAKGGRR